MARYYLVETDKQGNEYTIGYENSLVKAIKRARGEWSHLADTDKKKLTLDVRKYAHGTVEEIEESENECWDYDTFVWGLINEEKIKSRLQDMLIDFEVERSTCKRDIYLYVDAFGNGKLDIYDNPGGNDYRNDDHYTIYLDHQQRNKTDILTPWGIDTKALASDIGADEEELKKLAGVEPEDDRIEIFSKVSDYILNDGNLNDKLEKEYRHICEQNDWRDQTEGIIDEWYEQLLRDAEKTDREEEERK